MAGFFPTYCMEPDRRRQQDPEICVLGEEMSSAISTERQLALHQSEENEKQEDVHWDQEIEISFPQDFEYDEDQHLYELKPKICHKIYEFSKNTAKDEPTLFDLFLHVRNQGVLAIPTTSNTLDISLYSEELKKHKKKTQPNAKHYRSIIKSLPDLQKEPIIKSVYAGALMQSILKYNRDKNEGKKKQFGFYVVFFKDSGVKISVAAYPDPDTEKHSEEIIIAELNTFIQKHGREVSQILIYSYNSPCFTRKEMVEPCKLQLFLAAYSWYYGYGIVTVVSFTKFWGTYRSNYFDFVKFSHLTERSKSFYKFKISLELHTRAFKPWAGESGSNQHNMHDTHIHLKNLIEASPGQRISLTEYLEHLKKKILEEHKDHESSITFNKLCNSLMSEVREQLQQDFNFSDVQLFFKDLPFKNNDFIHFYHIAEGRPNPNSSF